jgi:hypothetical protein
MDQRESDGRLVFVLGGERWLIVHRDAVTVDELVLIGKQLGVIEG